MKLILFYEKPGCSTNAKQKKSLKDAGHMVITRNLLQMEMSKEELYSYLKDKSTEEWFNPNAQRSNMARLILKISPKKRHWSCLCVNLSLSGDP